MRNSSLSHLGMSLLGHYISCHEQVLISSVNNDHSDGINQRSYFVMSVKNVHSEVITECSYAGAHYLR